MYLTYGVNEYGRAERMIPTVPITANRWTKLVNLFILLASNYSDENVPIQIPESVLTAKC